MNLTLWPAKDPREKVTATFDYSAALEAGETIASAVVTVTMKQGTDPAPNQFLNGSNAVQGNLVLQGLQGGLNGKSYLVTCVATLSSGRVIAVAGVVPVQTIS